ncbi:hypothetical protein BJ508DRAFT_213453 [Ascobolus immersus RN42]|uniref:Rhodopsin domain-containing protein n=1 Tax=Ascobolus immersus RN42 TaxID=1160509 RepID=A0A3N4HTW0_ASCIM|nr:hypothetical protein BJ508DRAFT_213453 [Ascobolus immersus RN42]
MTDLLSLNSTGTPAENPFPIPKGVTPNYINPPTLAPIIFGVGISFSILSMLFVIGRMWSRHYLLRRVGFEDWLIVFSWCQSVFLVFCCCWSTRYGVGLHYWDIDPTKSMVTPSFPAQYVTTIVYPTVTTCIKFSILIFYIRLTPSLIFNRLVKATMALTFLIFLGTIFANIFACVPIYLNWDFVARFTPGLGTCVNQIHLWIAGAALHCLTDLVIFVLPIPLVLRSQLPTRQKWNAMVIFALGLLLVVASVVRLQMNILTLDPEQLRDYNWTGSRAMAWTTMEVNVGIIVACLPGIRPLLAHLMPSWFSPPESLPNTQPPSAIEIRTPHGGDYFATITAGGDDVYGGDGGDRLGVPREGLGEKRGSWTDFFREGKMVRLSVRKSKSGNLKVERGNESTAEIVQKEGV